MSKNSYYYYDHETCSFVEHKPKRTKLYAQITGVLIATLVLAGLVTWSMDRVINTPEELALQAENDALQSQLSLLSDRIATFSTEMEHLSQADQELYRTLLQAEPISDDVRQVGVGGADPYEKFNRFSPNAAALLRETSEQIDQLERQISLQNESYRELSDLAAHNQLRLAQMPAILPSEGPLVSGYGMRDHPILKVRRMHYGIDLLVPTGTAVVATGDGVIKETGHSAGFGRYVKISHPETGYTTLYAHLSQIPRNIRKNRPVKRGDVIGFSGNTGLSSAPHLHYEVHDAEGRPTNPILFFAPSMTPQKYHALLKEAEKASVSLD